jgi:hypothetical protein
MFTVSFSEYEAYCQADGMPSAEMLVEFEQRAALAERFGMEFRGADGFCAVRRRGDEWPFLVVSQRYSPAGESGFYPGLVVVPEAHRLFLGAGCRLLAYDLSAPARLWAAETRGFWSWSRYAGVVLMAGEQELAAWDVLGSKLWSRFVEPPWVYRVEGRVVLVDVRGRVSHLDLLTGAAAEAGPGAPADRPRD